MKRQAYEAAGIPEYWIVDPEARAIEVLALEDGKYMRDGLYRGGDVLRSPLLPGFSQAVDDALPPR